MTPLILLNILCGNKSCKGRKAVLRGMLFITIPLVSIYLLGMNQEEKMFVKKVFGKIKTLFNRCLGVAVKPILKI